MPTIRSFSTFGMIAATLALAGCDGGMSEMPMSSRSATISGAPAPSSPNFEYATRDASKTDFQGAPRDKSLPPDEVSKSATAGRKIIYNAHVDLVTEDLNKFEKSLTSLISTNKAYLADSDRTGSAGSSRHGSWKIRVPVDRYDPFVEAAKGLGELVSIKADSQDVSEEFFDLEAREAAKKVEETRLLKHLADSTGKLEEILAVERELSRVRSEIERMEGRLRALANLTSLATVTIIANEIQGYVPPQAPTLGTKIARSFTGSLDTLKQLGETILINAVAIVPWLPIIAIVVALLLWAVRRGWITLTSTRRVTPVPPAGNPQ